MKDWTCENSENFYSVGAEEEIEKCHSKKPESPRDPEFNIQK
jgi:hypothetical protein